MANNRKYVKFFILFLNICNVRCFNLVILHTNDVHAHVEEVNQFIGQCSESDSQAGNCFGGVARLSTKIKDIRSKQSNTLLLDAGDQFQGTLWFTTYKGLEAAFFMNLLQYDAMTLGNHEFDNGVAGLVPFLDNVTFPVLGSNLDVSNEPRLQRKISKSIVVTRGGEQIGIIGFVTSETSVISRPGDTVIFNEVVSAVREEVRKLKQANINKIIALGHIGYRQDLALAAAVDDIDILIGGHTNTFLYTGTPPSNEIPVAEYPTVVNRPDGTRTLVVQGFWGGKYVGFLNVTFDNGRVESWTGNPILLNSSIMMDPVIAAEVNRLSIPLEELKNQVFGKTAVFLEGDRTVCRLMECNIGNVASDAYVSYFADQARNNMSWTAAAIGLVNSGGIRGTITVGNITRNDVLTTFPFGNGIDLITLQGKYLREALEISVQNYDPLDSPGAFLQMSGVRVTYDLCRPRGQRVISVCVRCRECLIPTFQPLDDNKLYTVALAAFLVEGGDGFKFNERLQERFLFNALDSDIITKYFNHNKPITTGIEGRITIINDGTSCPVWTD